MNLPGTNPKRPPAPRGRVRRSIESVLGPRFGRLLERVGITPRGPDKSGLNELAAALLSVRGKASGPSLASALLDLYEASDLAERRAFLGGLNARFRPDPGRIERAIAAWREQPDEAAALVLNEATESPLQALIRQLNLAPSGTRRLIAMRTDLLANGPLSADERALDAEFEQAFEAWFNAGFLELRRIDWDSPGALLERIIRYEAVHSIDGWDDLRRRVEPADRRCYGFFHPQMADDPLIFVEVALTGHLPEAIAEILDDGRAVIDPHQASHAIFYSISNCQEGLRGIPFGNFLIKRVVGQLCSELPQLTTFATLSPVPGFARWLAEERGADVPEGDALRAQAARYLVTGRGNSGNVLDSVARFHLGNGARLEAVHAGADRSANGLRQAHGVMVNYVYDLAKIEENLLALTELGQVAASREVEALVGNAASEPVRAS